MDRIAIIHEIETMKIWQRDGERAPHKPLLILYAINRLLRNEVRLIPYSEVDEKLGTLLKEFGPRRPKYKPEEPFWRLQKNKIWEVIHACKINEDAGGSVSRKNLLNHKAYGGFVESVAEQFQNNSNLTSEIIQILLYKHFPYSIHEDILQAVGLESPFQLSKRQWRHSRQKERNPNFRRNILKAYEYRCAVCGFDVKLGPSPIALEAAHIKWYTHRGPDTEANGLALCSLHHKLFDLGAFTLSERLAILVSDDAHGSSGFQEWLMKFHGKEINYPQRRSFYPHGSFIGWHVREVFKGDYRE